MKRKSGDIFIIIANFYCGLDKLGCTLANNWLCIQDVLIENSSLFALQGALNVTMQQTLMHYLYILKALQVSLSLHTTKIFNNFKNATMFFLRFSALPFNSC